MSGDCVNSKAYWNCGQSRRCDNDKFYVTWKKSWIWYRGKSPDIVSIHEQMCTHNTSLQVMSRMGPNFINTKPTDALEPTGVTPLAGKMLTKKLSIFLSSFPEFHWFNITPWSGGRHSKSWTRSREIPRHFEASVITLISCCKLPSSKILLIVWNPGGWWFASASVTIIWKPDLSSP